MTRPPVAATKAADTSPDESARTSEHRLQTRPKSLGARQRFVGADDKPAQKKGRVG